MINLGKICKISLVSTVLCLCLHTGEVDAAHNANKKTGENMPLEKNVCLLAAKEKAGIEILFGCFMCELTAVGDHQLPIVVIWKDGTILWCPFLINWNLTCHPKMNFSDICAEKLGCCVIKVTSDHEKAAINRIASYRVVSEKTNQLHWDAMLLYAVLFNGDTQREMCIYTNVFPKESSKYLFVNNVYGDNSDLYQDLNTLLSMSLSLCQRFEAAARVQCFYSRLICQIRIQKLARAGKRNRRSDNKLHLGPALYRRPRLPRAK